MPATIMAGTPAVIVRARVPVTVIAQMNVTDADRSDVTALPGVERTWRQPSQGATVGADDPWRLFAMSAFRCSRVNPGCG
jgi:hypothetical protein